MRTYVILFFICLLLAGVSTAETGTVGYTGVGNSDSRLTYARGHVHSNETHTASANQKITWFHLYFSTLDDSATVGVAAYVISSGVPTTRLGQVATLSSTSSSYHWDSVAVDISMVSGTTYGMAVGDTTGDIRLKYNLGANGDHRSFDAGSSLNTSWNQDTRSSAYYSMYFTWESDSATTTSITRRRRKLIQKLLNSGN